MDPGEEGIGKATGLAVELWRKILEKLDFQELKTCRLVCKAWNREVCSVLSSHGLTSLRSSLLKVVMTRGTKLSTLTGLRILYDAKLGPLTFWNSFPFRSLKYLVIDTRTEGLGRELLYLFSSASQTIEYFSAGIVDCSSWEGWFPFCPNLRYFEVGAINVEIRILEFCPALKSLNGIVLKKGNFNKEMKVYPNLVTVGIVDVKGVRQKRIDKLMSKLITTFPNAKNWSLPSKVVRNFCSTANNKGHPVSKLRVKYKAGVYQVRRLRHDVCSHYPSLGGLQELEIVMMDEDEDLRCVDEWGRMEARALSRIKTLRFHLDNYESKAAIKEFGNVAKRFFKNARSSRPKVPNCNIDGFSYEPPENSSVLLVLRPHSSQTDNSLAASEIVKVGEILTDIKCGDVSEALDQELDLSIELWELIFKNLDVDEQKNCRLVCKSWNREICRIFQSPDSPIITAVGFTQFEKWDKLLTLRKIMAEESGSSHSLALSDPFKVLDLNVYQKYHTLYFRESSPNLLSYPIERLSLFLTDAHLCHVLQVLSRRTTHSLKHLQIYVKYKASCKMGQKLARTYFPLLETFSFRTRQDFGDDRRFLDSASDWVLHVLRHSPKLTSLRLESNCMKRVLENGADTFSNLRTLKLGLRLQGRNAFLSADLKHFRCLRHLTITSSNSPEEILRILSSVSKTIECFKVEELAWIDLTSWIGCFPFCPKLVSFQAEAIGVESGIFRSCPSLKSVKGLMLPGSDINEEVYCVGSCSNVETIGISDKDETVDGVSFVNDLTKLAGLLPSVKNWELPEKPVGDFCTFANSTSFPVEKLRVCFSLHSEMMIDLKFCTQIQQLEGLRELELIQIYPDQLADFGESEVKALSGIGIVRYCAERWEREAVEEVVDRAYADYDKLDYEVFCKWELESRRCCRSENVFYDYPEHNDYTSRDSKTIDPIAI